MNTGKTSWAWVTKDTVLCKGDCEVLYAVFIPSSSATATATLYNGVNTSGREVVAFRTAQSKQVEFAPPEPVHCPDGLYVDVIANPKGMFVQWRVLSGEKGE